MTTATVYHYLKRDIKSRVFLAGSRDIDWKLYNNALPKIIALYVKQNEKMPFIPFPPEIKFESAFIVVNETNYYAVQRYIHHCEGRYMLPFKLCPHDCDACATNVCHAPLEGDIHLKIVFDEGLQTDVTLYSVAYFHENVKFKVNVHHVLL